jgi:hypothetical protein
MTFNGRTATTLVMLALFVGASVLALGLPSKAAFMPLLIGVPGIILCAWQLVLDLRRAPDAAPDPGDDTPDDGQTETATFLWLGAFSVALIGFGFVVGGPIIVAAFVRLSSRESWLNAVFAGLGTLIVIYGVFIWLLGVPLFPGLVLRAIF